MHTTTSSVIAVRRTEQPGAVPLVPTASIVLPVVTEARIAPPNMKQCNTNTCNPETTHNLQL